MGGDGGDGGGEGVHHVACPKKLDKAPPVSSDAWKCFIESHTTYLPVSARRRFS